MCGAPFPWPSMVLPAPRQLRNECFFSWADQRYVGVPASLLAIQISVGAWESVPVLPGLAG